MKILTLKIKPLEPLIFRGSGEFDPSSRGVYTHAASLSLPRPSTIIGTLISTSISLGYLSIKQNINDWSTLLKQYEEILNTLGIEAVRGPYIYHTKQDEIYVPLIFGKKSYLVNYRQLVCLLTKNTEINKLIEEEKHGDMLQQLFSNQTSEELIYTYKKLEDLLEKYSLKLKDEWRLNIGLKDRIEEGVKNVKESYIYTVKYLNYTRYLEIHFKIITKEDKAKITSLKDKILPIKLGGEHRIAEITLKENLDTTIDNLISKTTINHALLLSPMPIHNSIKYIGKKSIIGLGYSLAKRKRKPIYPTILEGSIIYVNKNKNLTSDKLLRYGLYHAINLENKKEYLIMGRIGYASHLPIKFT